MKTEIISYRESLSLKEKTYIDVRSPAEFEIDHIPGAVNLPVFDNDERKEIGTLYKQAGKKTAVLRGVEIGSSRLSGMIQQLMEIESTPLIFVCARGGIRSSSVSSIASSLGIESLRIHMGYKGYRSYVTEALGNLQWVPELFVLHGLTGTGKTEIIRNFRKSVDLEKLAGHRSSIFGGIGISRSNQKRFETGLLAQLESLKNEKFILIEGESRKIGNLHLPSALYNKMKNSPGILVTASIDERVDIILNEYKAALDDPEIYGIVKSLKTKLGHKVIDEMLNLYAEKNYRQFVEILLEKYYDPLYNHSLKKTSCVFEVQWSGAEKTASIIEKKIVN